MAAARLASTSSSSATPTIASSSCAARDHAAPVASSHARLLWQQPVEHGSTLQKAQRLEVEQLRQETVLLLFLVAVTVLLATVVLVALAKMAGIAVHHRRLRRRRGSRSEEHTSELQSQSNLV